LEAVVPKVPTLEKIVAMTPQARRNLYNNALKLGTAEAKLVVKLIADNRLLASNAGGLPHEDPIILEMEEIIQSTAGRAAAKAASDDGLPAMAGVDPLLQDALGEDYGTFDTTNWAGSLVAIEMESMGYVQTKKKKMPDGCVAKTAAFFEKRR
jgi:hypothetical protein